MGVKGYIYGYFCNIHYTELLQLIAAFTLGVVFAPFSYGALYFVIFLVLYEFAYAYFTRISPPQWRLFFRVAVVLTSVYGWLIGRTLVGWRNPLMDNPWE